MTSHFDEMAQLGADLLLEQFGERDGAGDLAFAIYRSPRTPAAQKLLTGAIWSQVQFEEVIDEHGDVMRREARTCRVLRREARALGIDGFEFGATIDDPDGPPNAAWMLEETTTTWDDVFVTFGLVRIPLVRKGERRAAV